LQQPASEITDENKSEAMSFAAFRVLDDLFATETDSFQSLMNNLGYDSADQSRNPETPAGVGNLMADAILEFRHTDGSNQTGNDANGNGQPYSDTTGYVPPNPVGSAVNIEKWTPERVPIDSTPETAIKVQKFLTPQWIEVTPFALSSPDQFRTEPPEPFLLVDGTTDLENATITLDDGTELDINRDLIGTVINPVFISQAEALVETSSNLTDDQKLIAEFWEDANGTAFPPGTWHTFGQYVSARDNHSLDQDAKMFLALSNAIFDAGVATWDAKVYYDYVRPVRAIRELGQLGLIGEFNQELDGFAIDAWTPEGFTQTILATDFLTYQTPGGHPSPPFSEYPSGHSSFSAAGAAILQRFSGSNDFGASVSFEPGESRFEPGVTPNQSVTLTWDTFTYAAREAGLSRRYGGIHFADGDLNGERLGQQVAEVTWQRTQDLISGNTSP
ncbi:MAG: vanadium-dependent haloperoxidase, partial [Planctomycetaceae bacterium]|nr:vanadium-dependent haloperoxidase [Planctomycetaceae bacterium]